MSHDPIFSSIAQLLLQGKVICEVSYEQYFSYLQTDRNAERVNDFLLQLDRSLSTTLDRKAFLCAYVDADSADAQREIKAQFKEVVNHLESLVKWLRLVISTNPSGHPLSAGDILNESALLASIEQSSTMCNALDELARASLIRSTSADGKGKIKAITKRLVELGYLVPVGRSGSQFRATGKWSWLYDVMSFIRSHEDMQEEETSDQIEAF